MVIVDEDFWEDGIRIDKHSVSIAEMAGALIPSKGKEDLGAELDELRNRLATAMRHQPNVGGFDRRHLDGMTVEQCTHALRLEWKMVERLKLWPGMPRAELDKVARSIPAMRRAKRMVGIWGAVREFLQKPEISVSGRLVLDTNKAGERVVKHHWLAPIREQWQVPTLIMSATLPRLSILQAFYPQVEVVADIEVTTPHMNVRQTLNAPVSARRLGISGKAGGEFNRNRKTIRRFILERWLRTGRQPMLVITQEKLETWLKASGLPAGITIEHYNNIAGLDDYKDVRTLILVGRPIPGPETVEAYAGALTGAGPA